MARGLTYDCPHCGREVRDERLADRRLLHPTLRRLLDGFWRQERAREVCKRRGHLAGERE